MPLLPSGVPSRAAIQAEIDSAREVAEAVRAMVGIRARGTVLVSVASAPNGTATVTFPAGLFTSAPRVWASKQAGGLAKFTPYVSNVTTTGCTIGLYSGDGSSANQSNVPIAWEAVQD